uniref:Uncharacterized protein n=1 Tax=Solanum tuberosum TaxID=4113 RepID=M1DS71_SOLTU
MLIAHGRLIASATKDVGGDPSILIYVLRVKTFEYDTPGATLKDPEEDPNIGQASCQGSLRNAHGGSMSASRTSPTIGQKFGTRREHVADSTVSEFNFYKLAGTPPRRELVSRRNLRI